MGETSRVPPAIIAVVKADGYGHGAARIALALEQAGAPMLACADVDEGVALRQAGVRAPILVFNADSPDAAHALIDHALTPAIATPQAAQVVQAAAAKRRRAIGYHLKIDTGMHRLGLRHDELHCTLPAILASDHLRLEGVFTHFASAEAPDGTMFDQQCERFEAASQRLMQLMAASDRRPGSRGPSILRHACNSAALLRGRRAWYDAVRPGLLLYGVVPPPLSIKICLQPVMSVTSRIVSLKEVHEGEGVGYGSRFRASTPRTIAAVPAGYADGIDPRLGGCGQVLIRGHRVPIVGAVSMDMITVDVTDASDVQIGDEVVLLGEQGSESWQHIDARELAATIGTIPWEVLCRLGPRVERHFKC